MSLAFSITVGRSTGLTVLLAALHTTALAGVVLVAWFVGSGPAWICAAATAAAVLIAASAWRARYKLPRGALRVARDGSADWIDSDGAQHRSLVATAWYAGAAVVWMRLHGTGLAGGGLAIVVTRDAASAADWRRLHRWIVWIGRGSGS